MKKIIGITTCISISLIIALTVFSIEITANSDLYRVTIKNQYDAEALSAINIDAILRVKNGYLVLIKQYQKELFIKSNVESEFIADNINRSNLAVDARFSNRDFNEYELIFEEESMRLFKVDPSIAFQSQLLENVVPLIPQKLDIVYKDPPVLDLTKLRDEIDLDSLAQLIREDSLLSYLEELQSFDGRVAGGNSDSRNWIYSKLLEFDCDTVYVDSFVGGVSKGGTVDGNVVAVKTGSLYPHHYIVFGAHFDAVPGSPGVDDNGSGTAGVMEMARILKDVNTKMSFVFVLYDSEEPFPFLRGSWYHAAQMSNREDSVVLMINMDMIGHRANDFYAQIYYGPDDTYAQVWENLADTLSSINLTGFFYNDPMWDEYPYYQYGYDVLRVHESSFSTVYHSYRDSVRFINIEYMAKMVRSTMVTGLYVNETYTFTPGLRFSYPEGIPEILLPGISNSFLMQVEEYGGSSAVPGTGLLHYSVHMETPAYVPMVDLGNNLYEATFPVFSDFTRIIFRLSADEASLGRIFDYDNGQQFKIYCATGKEEVFNHNFDVGGGWSITGDASEGRWEKGIPVPAFMSGYYAQPSYDIDGIGNCYQTDNYGLDSDVDDGHTILTSPAIDLSGSEGTIQYYRWYSNDQGPAPNSDIFVILISNDSGDSWTPIESLGPQTYYSDNWKKVEFWISDFVAPSENIMVRFDVSDLGINSVVEAAIDNVIFTKYTCDILAPFITTTSLPEWTVGIPFETMLEATGGSGDLSWIDRDNDLFETGLGLSNDGILTGSPIVTGDLSFVAQVSDEYDSTDEKSYIFTINPAPIIESVLLPKAYVYTDYSQQLNGSGGTGTLSWSDLNEDLINFNFSLDNTGLISGLYTDTATIEFTASIVDEVGASTEQLFSLVCAFVCGDVNADGDCNVADLTYYVNYIFKQGIPPVYFGSADVDASGALNVADLTLMVNYIFKGGPDPFCE